MDSKRYTVKGTTGDIPTCDRCGRNDLLKAVVLVDNLTDEIVHFGSECAATVAGYTVQDITTAAKAADRAAALEAEAIRVAAQDAEMDRWTAFLAETTGLTDIGDAIRALGGFTAARAAYAAR